MKSFITPGHAQQSYVMSAFCRKSIEGASECFPPPTSFIIWIMFFLVAPTDQVLYQLFREIKWALTQWNLKIAPEKVQTTSPYQYLGTIVTEKSI